jgi:biotin carboxylase
LKPLIGVWPVHDNPKVLVVGTTADYIEWIQQHCPGRAIFLTDPGLRQRACETNPAQFEEILCNLSDYDHALEALKAHLLKWELCLDGITSFDCESMELAAVIANDLALSYPSVEGVNNCRDKFVSKEIWHHAGLRSPKSQRVKSAVEAIQFLHRMGGACVLKPLYGSGSELIFCCDNKFECERHFQDILNGLQLRRSNRLYRLMSAGNDGILAEEYVEGNEYSCDFIIENGSINVIRIARKILFENSPFGTANAYILPASLPEGIDRQCFERTLHQSASVLGLSRAICMLDFLIQDNEIILLEIAPRAGGDCLPFLIRQHSGLDILELSLDFAQQRPFRLPQPASDCSYIALRLHAMHGGVLKKIDAEKLRPDQDVCQVHLTRRPGHVVRMPPEDYDSWLLGHVIFAASADLDPEMQCKQIIEQIVVEFVSN